MLPTLTCWMTWNSAILRGLRCILLLLLGTALPVSAQSWVRTLVGPGSDTPAAIARTDDGGFVVAGATTSGGAGGLDGLVIRLDSCGNVVWQYAYGGTGDDLLAAVTTTANALESARDASLRPLR